MSIWWAFTGCIGGSLVAAWWGCLGGFTGGFYGGLVENFVGWFRGYGGFFHRGLCGWLMDFI